MIRLAIIGARGYVGAEMLRLVERHGGFDLTVVTSGKEAGRAVRDVVEGVSFSLSFEDLGPRELADREVDAVVLALPNGAARPYVDALDAAGRDVRIVDLSADHRFDEAWVYGQVERERARVVGAHRVANPGCYATAVQLAVAPFVDLLEGPAHAFGVSGYSGAGTTPSPRNDPEVLRDNILPYALTGHMHELEVSHHLAHPVVFVPHVAPFFRGITATVALSFRREESLESLTARLERAYAGERFVEITRGVPDLRAIRGQHGVRLGGLSVADGGKRAVLVSTIDNLLGGAASQALRNLNLMCGMAEARGLDP